MSTEKHGGMTSTGKTDSFNRALSGYPNSSHQMANKEEHDEDDDEISLQSTFVDNYKCFSTCRKILRHGADGFTSRPKEVVVRIVIALKNPSPRPGSKLRIWGPICKLANHYTTEATRKLYYPHDKKQTLLAATRVDL
jgi:hypothetical protein